MINISGSRREQILKLLLYSKNGLSIEEIAMQLEISRNATKQHLVSLEQAGLIQTDHLNLNTTGGRPSRNYMLTDKGIHQFPKQYAWFSQLLLAELKAELGEEKFGRYLSNLGKKLAQTLLPQFETLNSTEKISHLVTIMQSLGYMAEAEATSTESGIQAFNCIYHELAREYPQLCEFDLALISNLLDKPMEQTHCVMRDDCVCKFREKKS